MKLCLLFAGFLAVTAPFSATDASAQAIYAAHRAGELAAGITVSNAGSDYAPRRISGVTGYATFDVSQHFGVEADVRLLTLQTPDDIGERTYMAGLRYVYSKKRYEIYGKGLAGVGSIVAQLPYQVNPGVVPSSVFACALGGGLDIRIPKNLTVRAVDFEYQDWPNFASKYGGGGLNPKVISFGIAYRIR